MSRRLEVQAARNAHTGIHDPGSKAEPVLEHDGLQWLIDTSPKKQNWSTSRLVGEIMGIWYGSVHTLTIALTYALMDLYAHPSVTGSLREELRYTSLAELKGLPDELPLMDSFLKESARLSAFECTAVRRKTLQDFTFSDGLFVQKGRWICVPTRALMRDPARYEDPNEFQPFRFYKPKQSDGSSSQEYLAELSEKWVGWGLGRIAWCVLHTYK